MPLKYELPCVYCLWKTTSDASQYSTPLLIAQKHERPASHDHSDHACLPCKAKSPIALISFCPFKLRLQLGRIMYPTAFCPHWLCNVNAALCTQDTVCSRKSCVYALVLAISSVYSAENADTREVWRCLQGCRALKDKQN